MLSIVVPVFNEQESLPFFYSELFLALKSYKLDHEIIFVDDGSTDNSLTLLKDIAQKDTKVKVYSFRRNQGKAEALTLGFQKAKGNSIVTLDADLQDRPEELGKFLNKLKEGYEVVCGWRENRKDDLKKKIASKIFNFSASLFWGLHLHDYNCGFKAYTSEAAKSLALYGGMHRFIPLLAFQKGYKITEVPVKHKKRQFGKSKYSFSKIWKDLPDMFTMIFLSKYQTRPLHFFGVIGLLLFLIGSLILIYILIIKLLGQGIGDRPILFLGMILVLTGIQIFLTGFLADLIINLNKKDIKEFSLKYVNE